jgi:hypothetical protein
MHAIEAYGSTEQKEKYLPQLGMCISLTNSAFDNIITMQIGSSSNAAGLHWQGAGFESQLTVLLVVSLRPSKQMLV